MISWAGCSQEKSQGKATGSKLRLREFQLVSWRRVWEKRFDKQKERVANMAKYRQSTINLQYMKINHQVMLWNKFDFCFCLGRRSPIWLILSNHHFEAFRQSFGTLTLKVSRLHCVSTWLHPFLQISDATMRFLLSTASRWLASWWQIRATNSLVDFHHCYDCDSFAWLVS